MDGTQTSEPTETGPGSPGLASAFRRALDEQAISEGPLDLTAPLDFAEVRAALSTSGSIPVVRDIGRVADFVPPRAPGARRASRHASTKRLGRIAVFVALAAAMSVGTACALVLSSGGQGSSVSLPPTTGNIPVAPSAASSQPGRIAVNGGSASATSSLLHSASATASTASPSVSATVSASATDSESGTPSASTGASGGAGASGSPSGGPVNSAPSTWVTLYWGIPNEQQEISQVQTLLANLGLLDSYRRRSYYNPQVDVQPDQSGTYGSATEDAIEEFQQYYDVDYTGQFGTCDQVTYNALVQQAG